MARGTQVRRVALACAALLSLAACTAETGAPGADPQDDAPSERPAATFTLTAPSEPVTVLPASTAAEAAATTSQALYGTAPLVVTAGLDTADQLRAASVAVALGAPLLVIDPAQPDVVPGELERLGSETVLAFDAPPDTGDGVEVVTAPADEEALAELVGVDLPETEAPADPAGAVQAVAALTRDEPVLLTPADPETAASTETGTTTDDATSPGEQAELPRTEQAEARDDVVLLTTGAAHELAAVATARAAGVAVHLAPGGDPRASGDTVTAVAEGEPAHVLALGAPFGDASRLASRLAVVRTGVQLPGGGQTLFPGRRLVALYGHPGTGSLGVLGEQPLEEAIQRAQKTAAQYQPLSDRPVVPTFEIIATVASDSPGRDGNYSNEVAAAELKPWVDAAREAGVYVVLDLQPGTTDFLTQAKLYEDLLRQPHVGLALDPEWRLKPGQRHMAQIGSVPAAEVNAVADWLAQLTREHALPQKVLVLHQFRLSMITNRQDVITSHDEVAVLVHADGNGVPGEKIATWNAVRKGAGPQIWWGWKNFYDEDDPTFTPQQTYELTPVPDLVSYQ